MFHISGFNTGFLQAETCRLKREKASQKKRDKIIQTTIGFSSRKGVLLSSTTDVCAAAKLTRPTLYHYFGSKRNLLLSVHMETIERDLKPYIQKPFPSTIR